MIAAEWIDAIKDLKKYPSDYRVAKTLGISPQAITKMRAGVTKVLREDTCVKVAELLDIDPAIVLIDQIRENASDPVAKEAWTRAAKTLLAAAKPRVPRSGPKKTLFRTLRGGKAA